VTIYSAHVAVKSAYRRHFRSAWPLTVLAALLALTAVPEIGGGPGAAWALAPEPEPITPDHIPIADISPGMTGFGLTVFQGSVVDTFGVTVIGVQKNVRAAGNLLLIEVSGHGLETSSIAQGMSGSPIYLDGRFAGALAFGWGGALRPIAGVTPAAEMLALPTHIPDVAQARQQGVFRNTASRIALLIPLGTSAGALAAEVWGKAGPVAPAAAASMDISGWPDAPQMWLKLAGRLAAQRAAGQPQWELGPDQWIFQRLALATGGSGQSQLTSANRLVPGAACAVPLVTGDAALGAIGTVTWVEGDQVLMMGHPFMQRGPVNLPLATAEVLTVFPSRQMSFKMGSVGTVIGTVHHDLRAGLSGRMGVAPQMIPVTVTVAREGAADLNYNFAVVDDPMLTPTLVFWTIYNGLLATGDDASLQTMRYRVETTWTGPRSLSAEPLVLSGVTAGPGGAAGLAVELMAPLSILLNNPHAEVRLRGVRATLAQAPSLQTATIVGLTSPRSILRAGEKVVFHAEIEPRQGPRETIDFPVTLPTHLPAGPYRVVLTSAAELFALEAQRASGRFQPVNLSGILEILRTDRTRDTLVLALLAPGEATILQGQELHNLPHSIARTVRSGNMQAQRSLADYVWRSARATPWVLTGHAVRSLRVQPADKPLAEERRP